ncbi:MAG: bifunctional (p)ppGpp synthetase/guanosine-3',5'-bis(diphosphate) 3'-pyrophosphohydrolase, partial [Bacteroidetes bacterium]|nr:bifunctional (p)ppGpp synthetase/guanosine-3',5'-bis(diphosphate) 3'-pyrophosphohydrolase [Bacteroidota bacterium]
VVTHKAKTAVRKWINKEEDEVVEAGKSLWEKRTKKMKLSFSENDINKLITKLKFDNIRHFYKSLAHGKISIDEILTATTTNEEKGQVPELKFENFKNIARGQIGNVIVDGDNKGILYSYAECCNPLPGDPIIGFITVGEGIKIHRKICTNLLNLSKEDSSKLVPVQWPSSEDSLFVAGLTVKGEDAPGILNDISHAIVTYQNTNIKSINISTNKSTFEGSVTVYVQNLEHLSRLVERLKKLKCIYSVERFEQS